MFISEEFLKKQNACNGYSAWFEKNQMYDQPDAVVVNLLIEQKLFDEANWLLLKCLSRNKSIIYVYTAILQLELIVSETSSSLKYIFKLIKQLGFLTLKPESDKYYKYNLLNISVFTMLKHLISKHSKSSPHYSECHKIAALDHFVDIVFFHTNNIHISKLVIYFVLAAFKDVENNDYHEKIFQEILEKGLLILKYH